MTIVDKNGSSSRDEERGREPFELVNSQQTSTKLEHSHLERSSKKGTNFSISRLVRTGKGIGHKQPVNDTLSPFLPLVSFLSHSTTS